MPDDADAPVAVLAVGLGPRVSRPARLSRSSCICRLDRRADRLLQRDIDGVELVIAGHLLDDLPPPTSSKTMKCRTRSRNRRFSNTPSQQHLQLGQIRGCVSSPRSCARA